MSFKIEHPRIALPALAVAALALWWTYGRTMSPAYPPDDSPETIAAAATLGIQHPPGYPLPCLLGRCAVLAWPLGSPDWRINQLSGALAVLAAVLAALLAWRLSTPLKGAAAAAPVLFTVLAAGLWSTLWDQATEAKGGLYLLNLVLGFGLWHACLSAWEGGRRACAAAGLLAGLSLAGHFLSAGLWLAPLGAWMAWGAARGKLRGAGLGLALLAPGLALYLYLPLRARLNPAVDLGHPVTWSQFWWMVGRGGYTQAGVADGAGTVREQAGLWWRSLWTSGALGLPRFHFLSLF